MATRCRLLLGCLALTAAGGAEPIGAQTPLFLVNDSTEVRSLHFRFADARSFDRETLGRQIATTSRGTWAGVRGSLSFLPLVSDPGSHPFDPVELHKDVIRLRRFYEQSGFMGPTVAYDVRLDSTENRVDVHFLIDEGVPIRLQRLLVDDDASPPLPTELQRPWTAHIRRVESDRLDRRMGSAQIEAIADEAATWLRDRGYATASVVPDLVVDSATATAQLHLAVNRGTRRRIGAIEIEGNQEISEATLRREIPVAVGDWYSASRLADGERELLGLDMIRWANTTETAEEGELVTVSAQVEEGHRRLITGQVGYASSSGATLNADWSNRNFRGGARVLTIAGEARTGLAATDETFEQRYGLSVSLRQPYLGSRRVSGVLTPFIEYRDGAIDRSQRNGADATVVVDLGGLNSVSFRYGISARQVYEYRFGTLTETGADVLSILAIIDDSLGTVTRESLLTVSGVVGSLDNRATPRQGLVGRASAQLAGPSALSRVEFGKLTASVSGFLPLGADVYVRLGAFGGRVLPYGKSIPAGDDDRLIRFLELRSALLTVGGTGDVRGWGDGLLGPKIPDLRLKEQDDSLFAVADRYVPVGGLARLGFSAELAVPLPGTQRRHMVFAFLDGGRVWTPDERLVQEDPFDQDGMFFGAGAGLELGTLLGPVRIAVAYKLNPSLLDERDPTAVQQAFEEGRPITSVPPEGIRRFQLHIDLGRLF